MTSACTLVPWQCITGPVFHTPTVALKKAGLGDEGGVCVCACVCVCLCVCVCVCVCMSFSFACIMV